MNSKIISAAFGLAAGLVIGFTITNELNRNDMDVLRAQLAQAGASRASINENRASATTSDIASTSGASTESFENQAGDAAPRLSRAEVAAAVAQADAKPQDVYQQRYLGQMLYLYASQTDDVETLSEAARLLERAHQLDSKNYETLVLLGNALFDLGNKGDARNFTEARRYYAQALKLQPDDVNVRTDYGLTFFFAKPSQPEPAIAEYRKSLRINPRHEATLQNLVAALVATRKFDEAAKTLAQLKNVNAANPSIASLQAQLTQARNAAQLN